MTNNKKGYINHVYYIYSVFDPHRATIGQFIKQTHTNNFTKQGHPGLVCKELIKNSSKQQYYFYIPGMIPGIQPICSRSHIIHNLLVNVAVCVIARMFNCAQHFCCV